MKYTIALQNEHLPDQTIIVDTNSIKVGDTVTIPGCLTLEVMKIERSPIRIPKFWFNKLVHKLRLVRWKFLSFFR